MDKESFYLAVIGIIGVVIIAISVATCNYQTNVVLPLRMAEQNLCWGPLNSINYTSMGWRPCAVLAVTPAIKSEIVK